MQFSNIAARNISTHKMSFKDKVVVVTGSSSGIGASTVIEFAKEAAHVVIVGRNVAKLESVSEKCQKYGQKPLVIKADVSKDAEGQKIINETIEKFGRIDVLVNNAGSAELAEITSEKFMKAFDNTVNLNLRGVVNITHCAVPHLIKSKGNIINISSVAAHGTISSPDMISYCVSKAALNHFTRCAALKLAIYGVRVNAICPGPVRTDLKDTVQFQQSWEQFTEMTALKRVSEPEEIADLILFLASDKAKGITGSDFVSDNGLLVMK
ncbi:unnamed protein product, partial [Iphiclides podalirius]